MGVYLWLDFVVRVCGNFFDYLILWINNYDKVEGSIGGIK